MGRLPLFPTVLSTVTTEIVSKFPVIVQLVASGGRPARLGGLLVHLHTVREWCVGIGITTCTGVGLVLSVISLEASNCRSLFVVVRDINIRSVIAISRGGSEGVSVAYTRRNVPLSRSGVY